MQLYVLFQMSKQTGNFLTLLDGVNTFSADGMRLALAVSVKLLLNIIYGQVYYCLF